ncbi:MAG TPA: RNA polymerase factor sigma-54 [Kiritimatiellia bacterium]|mgnify:CR=1 FL=1|nr:RNA polymerase factor sigma-54 [Kiritimatiellia bacterium]HPC49269.1 RNA polymerase factor sigma-54 [Kiritimatiellia bacterium]HPK36754.1 RNA polymerase factor sigma-54 [Kiritimatiellia bacterium]HRU20213.1 RNA polymerase factor sigma-54 [Kiritimatiellia bacterium]
MAVPSLSLSQQQRQVMTLAPQLRQSLEMLQMPVMELRAAILNEMSVNPTIEEVEDPSEVSLATVTAPEPQQQSAADEELDFNPDIDAILRQDDEWRDYFMQGMENAPSYEEENEKRQYLLDSIRQKASLQDYLLEQLTLTDLQGEDYDLAVLLIGNISDDGYFTGSLPDIIMVSGRSEREVLDVLKVIQTFDPPGVGARTLRECLLLQLALVEDSPWEDEARLVIDKHLERLGAHDEKYLCKVLELTREELAHVTALIRSLNPRPGRAYVQEKTEYVEPEVFLVREKGRLVARVDNQRLPHIHISKHYRSLLEDRNTPAETKTYIRERIRAGAFLIRSLYQRQETIRKIAQEIVDAQADFWEKGVMALRPLTMAEVARKVGVHETTVSRTVSNKYMRTPRGVFEMRYFFTHGLKSEDGVSVSNKSVQDQIRRLVEAEDPTAPLSDQALEEKLSEQGIKVARRTIAKYRGILKIPPSHKRRRT